MAILLHSERDIGAALEDAARKYNPSGPLRASYEQFNQ